LSSPSSNAGGAVGVVEGVPVNLLLAGRVGEGVVGAGGSDAQDNQPKAHGVPQG
jgi:hypothetical protein